jgi:hypothetical protein
MQPKGLEVNEVAKLSRNSPSYLVPAQAKKLESSQSPKLWRYTSYEVIVLKAEIPQGGEISN